MLSGERVLVAGRSSQADVPLLDDTVSRRHCSFTPGPAGWIIADLGSKHGTRVNGEALTPGEPRTLAAGDVLAIGPWVLRLVAPGTSSSIILPREAIEDEPAGTTAGGAPRVRTVLAGSTSDSAQQRLDLLVEATASATHARDEAELATVVCKALLSGTGYARAALVRASPDTRGVEVLGFATADGAGAVSLRVSKSLVSAALASGAGGDVLSLGGAAPGAGLDAPAAAYGQSVMDLGITAALCAPVVVDGAPVAALYLDTRRGERARPAAPLEAAAMARALARIAAFGMANQQRVRVLERQRRMEQDLAAAHHVQRMLLPEPAGTIGPMRYAMRFVPGGFLAGDLFDVIRTGERSVVFLVGDVAGHGAAASLLMVAAQARLRSELSRGVPIERAVEQLNGYVAGQTARTTASDVAGSVFLSLFAVECAWGGSSGGVGERPRVACVDAGHGYAVIRRRDGSVERVSCVGGLPVGVTEDATFEREPLELGEGDRLCVFTDGLAEQPDAQGSQFGFEKVLATLAGSADVAQDPDALWNALCAHAAPRASMNDDVTIAAIDWA